MEERHYTTVYRLLVKAYITAANINSNIQDRMTCIKYLATMELCKVDLMYEGFALKIHPVIYKLICLIKSKYNTDVALKELTKFYPELKENDWIFDAVNSSLFDLTLN